VEKCDWDHKRERSDPNEKNIFGSHEKKIIFFFRMFFRRRIVLWQGCEQTFDRVLVAFDHFEEKGSLLFHLTHHGGDLISAVLFCHACSVQRADQFL